MIAREKKNHKKRKPTNMKEMWCLQLTSLFLTNILTQTHYFPSTWMKRASLLFHTHPFWASKSSATNLLTQSTRFHLNCINKYSFTLVHLQNGAKEAKHAQTKCSCALSHYS